MGRYAYLLVGWSFLRHHEAAVKQVRRAPAVEAGLQRGRDDGRVLARIPAQHDCAVDVAALPFTRPLGLPHEERRESEDLIPDDLDDVLRDVGPLHDIKESATRVTLRGFRPAAHGTPGTFARDMATTEVPHG